MAKSLHLIDLEGTPKRNRGKLNHNADRQQSEARCPKRPANFSAVAQKQRHGDERDKLDCGRNVAVTPGKVAAPVIVSGIEKNIERDQNESSGQVGLDLRGKTPPLEHSKQ